MLRRGAARRSSACTRSRAAGAARRVAACRAAGRAHGRHPARHRLPEVLLVPPRPPDEADCPRARRAPRVFGAAARRLLVDARPLPRRSRLVLTGSPRVRRAAGARALLGPRRAARARWASRDGRAAGGGGQPLPRHPRHPLRRSAARSRPWCAPCSALGVRVRSSSRTPRSRTASTYAAIGAGGPARIARAVPVAPTCSTCCIAADALVTVESLSAVEALVLGRPVVVLNMPTHLRALVDAGVALGVAAGARSRRTALRRALARRRDARTPSQHARALLPRRARPGRRRPGHRAASWSSCAPRPPRPAPFRPVS